jgi:hypothetical protein
MEDRLTEHVIVVPVIPADVGSAWVAKWYKCPGDSVVADENLLDLETEHVVLEVPSPRDGILQSTLVELGRTVTSGEKLATLISVSPPVLNNSSGERERTYAIPKAITEAGLRIVEQRIGPAGQSGKQISASFLGAMSPTIRYDRCFIVMPYSQPWSEGVEVVIVESCRQAGLEPTIAKTMEGRFVPHDIWTGITSSGLVIADLSGVNANVAYEVGLADAIGREVILLSQTSSVPFDFSGHRLLLYENSVGGAIKLRNQLTVRLETFRKQAHGRESLKPAEHK